MAQGPDYPKARDMRDLVKIQRRSTVPTALGGVTGDWYDLIPRRRAQLQPFRPRRTGGTQDLAGRAQVTAPFDMYLRYDSETSQVTPDDRVVDLNDPSRTFKIGFIQDLQSRRLWLTFQLELGVADG